MLDIMSQAQNAIEVYNSALNVHSANIANMSVVGYKRLDVSFQSIFEKVLSAGTPASGSDNLGGTNPMQFGQGVAVAGINVDMSQGDLVAANNIDLAISGQGFFIVSNDGGNTNLYSRAGQFSVVSGNLVNQSGMQVYGLNSAGSMVPITGLAGSSANYSWDSSGQLLYNTLPTGYRIAMTYFENPGGLLQAQGTTLKETMASGSAAAAAAPGGTAGTISPGQLEQSNVFYLGETIDTLKMQEAMNGNLSIVRMASDLISSFITRLG